MKKLLICIYFVTLVMISFAGDYGDVKDFTRDSVQQGKEEQLQGAKTENKVNSAAGVEDKIGLEYGIRMGHYGSNFVKVTFMRGYNFNPYFYLGAGTGFKYYFKDHITHLSNYGYPSIPLFASFRMNFVNHNFTPYLAIDAGYSYIAGYKDLRFFYNPTFGLRFSIGNKSKMNVGVGYDKQMVKQSDRYYDTSAYFEAFNVNIGVSF